MKTMIKSILTITTVSILITGCMSWPAGWTQFEKPSVKQDVPSLLTEAEKQSLTADTKEKVLEAVKIYENVLKADPKNQDALLALCSLCGLNGYGYSDSKEEMAEYLLKVIKYSEQLMYMNSDFKTLIDQGENVWDACRVLSKNDLDAIFWYYLGTGLYWRECLSSVGKIINIQSVFRTKKILNRIMEIDPTWNSGTPYYLWANFYASAPGFAGGDMEKAEECYKKAIELGPEMLNFRRTRALFFHTKNKDRESFEQDLKWVLQQDPHKVTNYLNYSWNAFIQQNARNLLDHIDAYF